MVEVTGTVTEITPALGAKKILVTTPSGTDDGDTVEIDLADYGCTTFAGIVGWTHSTTGSVVIMEDPTTSVSGTVLTITVGGSTDDKVRVFEVTALGKDDTNVTAP